MLAIYGLYKMDFSSITLPILIVIVLIILKLFSMIYHRFYPELFTRVNIRKILNGYLYKKHYQLVENIDIICTNGQQLVIKQLLVSRYGLFIIDTYHYRGIIYGSDHQVKWLSQSKMSSTKFINPSMERQPTSDLLASYLHLPNQVSDVINIFTGNSQLLSPPPKNCCNVGGLINIIDQHKNVLINPALLPDIVTVLTLKQNKTPLIIKNA